MAFLLPPSLMALVGASLAFADSDNNSLATATARFRPSTNSDYRFVPPRAAPANPDANAAEHDEFDLLDIVLVASVDGKFHALNRTSGQTVWSMTSPSSPSTNNTPISSLAPLVRTAHPDHSYDEHDDDYDSTQHRPQELYVIEPQSGEIFVLPSPSAALQQFPYTMPQLVDMSPFSFRSESESRMFIGKKETSLLVLELETGRVRAIDAECPWDPDPWGDFEKDGEVDLDELEDLESDSSRKTRKQPKATEVLIGRTDYHISIHTQPNPSLPDKRPPPIQKLTFSTYGPNNQDHALQATYRRPKDNQYIQSMPGGEIISFLVKPRDGRPDTTEVRDAALIWAETFGEPIVAVFDILRRQDHSKSAFALLQPRPRLADVLSFNNFPSSPLDAHHAGDSTASPSGLPQAVLNALPNINSAFVGIVRESGSLYAMSPERFPLVAFGLSNNAETYPNQHGKLLDPPSSEKDHVGKDEDLPIEVDAITRARKIRERQQQLKSERLRCYTPESSTETGRNLLDPSCLTGVRRLETGSTDRARRLLDGVPGVEAEPTEGAKDDNGHNVEIIESDKSSTDESPGNGTAGNSWWVWRSGRYWSGNGNIFGLDIARASANSSEASRGIFDLENGGSDFGYANFLLTILLGAVGVFGVWMRFARGRRARDATKKVKENGHAHQDTQSNVKAADASAFNTVTGYHEIRPLNGSAISQSAERLDTHIMEHVAPSPEILASSPAITTVPDIKTLVSSSDAEQIPNGSPLSNSPKQALDDAEESDKDGDGENDNDNDGDGDAVQATPGRRKGTRRKRGKKKKVNVVLPPELSKEDKEAPKQNGVEEHLPQAEKTPQAAQSGIIIEKSKSQSSNGPSLTVSDSVLGFGSHGTVVFRGSLQGRAVAVKRLLIDFVTLAEREVSILQESDDHPNVIRYYYQEASGGFLYIALELCPASLADIVETPDREQWHDIAITFDPKRALKQITSGLRHLHALKLVHRDIKPQNILVSAAKGAQVSSGRGGNWRMLISDFGLCKKLDVDQTSFLPTVHGAMAAGTVGWRAPEILRGDVRLYESASDDQSLSSRGSVATPTSSYGGTTPSSQGKPTRLTKSVDIFALGCLYYYTLTSGGHPYGDRFERDVNIMKNAKNLDGLERFGEEGAEAIDLIEKMLDPEAKSRPDATTCLLHPFFWDPGRRLTFLQDASDRFEIMCREPKDPALVTLETDAFNVVGHDWLSRLDKIFIENLGKFRKYDGKSVQDLLRALRNKKNHYQDLPDNVKRHLGPMPEGFLSYFTRRYPRLFLHVHSVIGQTGLSNESMFRSYFELTDQ